MHGINDRSESLTTRERFGHFTKTVAFVTAYMGFCAFNFGYDVGNFGGVQGMQSFAQKFGEYNHKKNIWQLPAYLSSIMTATPFLGKAIACAGAGLVAEKLGRKKAILVLCILSVIGVTLEVSATTPAQFTLGRVFAFAMTGFTIVIVPIYQAECAPKALRGLMTSTLQFIISFGQLTASLVNYGCQNISGDKGWRLSVGLQLITPIILLGLLRFVPESPRWLISRDRTGEAVENLRKLRKKSTPIVQLEIEVDALRQEGANRGKGGWGEVFDKNNRRRTFVALLVMFFQQATGQVLVSQYSVVFYQQQGFADKAYFLTIMNFTSEIIMECMVWFIVDRVGRRPLLLTGATLMASCQYIMATLSVVKNPNESERTMMVVSLILFGASYNFSWAVISWVVLGEVAASRIKEKTNLLATTMSVIITFVSSFTLPYLLNAPYANLQAKVGYIYGSICWVSVIMAFFFVPELKGRSLEEVDQLFASGAPLRKFKSIRTEGVEDRAHQAKSRMDLDQDTGGVELHEEVP